MSTIQATAAPRAATDVSIVNPAASGPPVMTYAEHLASGLQPVRRKKTQPKRSPQGPQVPTPMRPAAADSWEALQRALDTRRAACKSDSRYVKDKLTPAETAELDDICAGCPVYLQCANYARTAKPAGGYWPTYNKTQAPKRDTAA